MAFVGYNLDVNSTELVTRLRNKQSVFVVAGDWFGIDYFLRFGIGGETQQLVEGMALVDEFFRQ